MGTVYVHIICRKYQSLQKIIICPITFFPASAFLKYTYLKVIGNQLCFSRLLCSKQSWILVSTWGNYFVLFLQYYYYRYHTFVLVLPEHDKQVCSKFWSTVDNLKIQNAIVLTTAECNQTKWKSYNCLTSCLKNKQILLYSKVFSFLIYYTKHILYRNRDKQVVSLICLAVQ